MKMEQLYYIKGAPNILCENQIIRQLIPDDTQQNARALHTHVNMGTWDIDLDRDSMRDLEEEEPRTTPQNQPTRSAWDASTLS